MHTQPSLGHAEAYINVHLSRSGPGLHGKPVGPFVTVSRESGTGGSTFARALATRLDNDLPGDTPWTVFDRNLVEAMLSSRHLSPRLARFLPEDKVSEIDASVGELVGLHPSLWELTQRTNEMMRQLARAGHVILVGRGANCATAGLANGVHVRLVAPAEHRARHAAQELDVTPAAGQAHNEKTDAARRKYVRSVFDAEIDRASGYDLVINVATIPGEQAAGLVCDVLLRRVAALR
jgi:cytidylate kinase